MIPRKGKKKKSLASESKHQVWIQTFTKESDNEGGFVKTWSNSQLIYAAIYPVKSSQVFQYKTVDVETTHIIKIRGLITINDKNRILFGTRVFEILWIDNIQERDFVKVLSCKERVVAGDDDGSTTTPAP